MVLDHERLDVYLVALDFVVFANEVVERLPRGRSHLADQLTRASTSIVLNLAEGAGKLSKPDKRRYYLTRLGDRVRSTARRLPAASASGRRRAPRRQGADRARRIDAHQARDESRGFETRRHRLRGLSGVTAAHVARF